MVSLTKRDVMKVFGLFFSFFVALNFSLPATAQDGVLPEFLVRDIPHPIRGDIAEFNSIILKPKKHEMMKPLHNSANEALFFSVQQTQHFHIKKQAKMMSGHMMVYQFLPDFLALKPNESIQQRKARMMEMVHEMSNHDDVDYAEPNYIMHTNAVPNDPYYKFQWHYHNNGKSQQGVSSPGGINLPKAWDITQGSTAVTVAVIDTGILPNQREIYGSRHILPGYDFITNVARANDGNGRDNDPTDPGDPCTVGSVKTEAAWHGSHVAGTVGVGQTNNGTSISGVNWNINILPVRVLGVCGGTTVDIIDGLRWAAGLPVLGVPDNPNPAKVINMSLGGQRPCTVTEQKTIDEVTAAGVFIVVAAGNAHQDVAMTAPANCNNVFRVAASDARGYLATRYSNYGAKIDIMAPGGDVRRDDNHDNVPDGVLSYGNDARRLKGLGVSLLNGTSMAAPHVAGVAALLLAQNPDLTPAEIGQIIKKNAIPRSKTQCPKLCGAGLLNANIDLHFLNETINNSKRINDIIRDGNKETNTLNHITNK